MAYVQSDLTPEEQQQQLLQQQQGGAGLSSPGPTSGASGLLAGGTQANPGVTVASQPTPQASPNGTNSGFVNLQSYLNANKDQAANFGNQIAQGISQTGQGAQSAIDNAAGQYTGTLSAQNTPYDSGLVSRATANPTDFVKNQDDVSKFTTIRDNTAKDPGTFESQAGYGDLASKAQSAQDNATLVQKANPTASQGVNNLDNLLISGNPDAQQSLLKASQPYADLKNYLGTATQNADKSYNALIGNNANNQKQLQDQFVVPQTGVLNNLESSVNQKISSAGQGRTQTNQAIQDLQGYLAGKYGSLDPTEVQLFNQPGATAGNSVDEQALVNEIGNHGLTAYAKDDPQALAYNQKVADYLIGKNPSLTGYGKTWADKYGQQYLNQYKTIPISPVQYLKNQGGNLPSNWLDKYFPGTNEAQTDPTAANVASPEESAKILALEQLIGGNGSQFLKPEDLAQAGTYKPASIGKWAGI